MIAKNPSPGRPHGAASPLPSLLAALGVMALPVSGTAAECVSVASGSWTDGATWDGGRAPEAGDSVTIARGTEVVFDRADADDGDGRAEVIHPRVHVAGVLRFATDRDTTLHVCVLTVGPTKPRGTGVADHLGRGRMHGHGAATGGRSSRLEIGTADAPVPAGVTARVVLHYLDAFDIDEAPAVVALPGGRIDLHGAPLSRTWVDLGADAVPGSTEVVLAEPVTGWRPGDTVVVTGETRVAYQGDDGEPATEERRVIAVREEGARLVLDAPLRHRHAGTGRNRCEVANLSRNVIVESASPLGEARGHTMFHRHSAGSIGYARFAHLGKRGLLGRYPIHFHLVGDSLRGTGVVGAAIVDSHNRWVTVHGSDYLVVRDCVGYRSVGHGFFLEDGTEVYNVFDRNLAIQAVDGERLPDQALPFDPNDGAGFWWANGKNTFVRNTACENQHYGFRYDCQKRSNFDPVLPVRTPSGTREPTDIRTIPIFRFEGNEAHTEGLYGFALAGTEGAGPDQRHPHRLIDNTAWQVHYAFRLELPTMLVERTRIDQAAYGIYRPWFDHHVYRDLEIARTHTEPFNRGLDDRSLQHGPVTVDGLVFRGIRHGHVPLVQLSAHNPEGRAETHLRNVRIEETPDGRPRALVNMGGGPRVDDEEIDGVPVFLHDWFGPGRTAMVVSSRARACLAAPSDFREEEPVTGDESRVRETEGVPFPQLLDPIDDEPPAGVITWPPHHGTVALGPEGALVVRGTATDDGGVAAVRVNGTPARDVDFGFHRWEARLEGLEPGEVALTATATDAAGNTEATPHTIRVRLVARESPAP